MRRRMYPGRRADQSGEPDHDDGFRKDPDGVGAEVHPADGQVVRI